MNVLLGNDTRLVVSRWQEKPVMLCTQSLHRCQTFYIVHDDIYALFPKSLCPLTCTQVHIYCAFLVLSLKFSIRKNDLSTPNMPCFDSKHALFGVYLLLPIVCLSEMCRSVFCRPFLSVRVSFFTWCYETRPNNFNVARLLIHKMHL